MNNDQDRFPMSPYRTLLKRLEFGSIVFAPYVLAIVWQYFSALNHKPFAWVLSVVVSVVVWTLYVSLSENHSYPLSWTFWLVVALPLLFFYLIRLHLPDISFDVLNYHIFHSERAL